MELDFGFGGRFAIGVQHDASDAVDLGGLQSDLIPVQLRAWVNRD